MSTVDKAFWAGAILGMLSTHVGYLIWLATRSAPSATGKP